MNSSAETALIQVKTEEEREIERLLSEIEHKRNHAAELMLILEDLKLELKQFEAEYNAQIGRLYAELDEVELSIREYRLRLRLLREGVSPYSPEMEKRVRECFQHEREKLKAYQQKTKKSKEDQRKDEKKDDEKIDSSVIKKLRRLYFRLAKIYHPDKVKDEEKDQKQKIMSVINRAYKEKDIQTLERLVGDVPTEQQVQEEDYEQKKKRLKREIVSLNRSIRELKLEIRSIKSSHNYKLKMKVKQARERGDNFFSKLAKDIRRKTRASKRKLNRLVNMFTEIMSKDTYD